MVLSNGIGSFGSKIIELSKLNEAQDLESNHDLAKSVWEFLADKRGSIHLNIKKGT